jgi:hypothetical protein
MYNLFVLNHNNSLIDPRVFQTYDIQDESIKSALRILRAIICDYKQEPYIFMENKSMDFDGVSLKGVHIYSGNIGWSCFVENAAVEGEKIGPLGTKLDFVKGTNYEA